MSKFSLTGKKKTIAILVAVAVVLGIIAVIIHHATKLTNDSYENCAMGDVNGDGYISASDALLVIQSMSDKNILFENQMLHADVNHDGEVNSSDALILLRFSVGEIAKISDAQKPDKGTENARSASFKNESALSTVQIVNEWDNGDGTHSYQLGITVRNNSKSEIDFWNATIKLSGNAKLTKNWDCKCRINSDEVSVNGESVPVESAAVCGFIVKAPEGLTINKIETECK